MAELPHLKQFLKFWFSSKAVSDAGYLMRIIRLASHYRTAVLKVDAPTKEGILSSEQVALDDEEWFSSLADDNRRGYDCYYMINPARADVKNATNADVLERVFIGLDLDYRLPLSVEELESELGLRFSAVIETSKRGFARHQFLIEVDEWSTSDVEEQRDLAALCCDVTASDAVHDAKRIFRLPGLLNWKGITETPTLERPVSASKLLRAEHLRYYSDDIKDAFRRFGEGKLSQELRALKVQRVAAGGSMQGERGEYGRWEDALDRALKGVPPTAAGNRHNALYSWIWQMGNARLAESAMVNNYKIMASALGYESDDKRDYEMLLREIPRVWARIDAEMIAESAALDAAMSEEIVEESEDGEPTDCEVCARPIPTDEVTLDFGPESAGPESIVEFANWIASQCEGETEDHWLAWIASCLNAVNHFEAKDRGTISRICGVVEKRFLFVRAMRRGRLHAPMSERVVRRARSVWSMQAMSDNQVRLIVRNLLAAVSEWIINPRARPKILKLVAPTPSAATGASAADKQSASTKELARGVITEASASAAALAILDAKDARGRAKKQKSKTVFGAQGELLTAFEREMVLRLTNGGASDSDEDDRWERRALAFQNGIFDLDEWERILEQELNPWDTIDVDSMWRVWRANPASQARRLNPALSWIAHPTCSACSIGVPRRTAMNGHDSPQAAASVLSRSGTLEKALETPMFDAFMQDCFPDDAEARRGVLLVIAYCLLPDNPLQRYFFLEGVAGAGKGTLATLISLLVGEQNTGLVDIERMKSDAWLGPMESKSLIIIDEAENNDPRVMRRVMHELARVTGSKRVTARSLHSDARMIPANWRFILIANAMPDAADKSGQQARRAVPLYFGSPKKSGVVRDLAQRIYAAEGNKIATKAVTEYLTRGMARNEALFEVDSPAFQIGKARFDESTGGLRRILKVFSGLDANMAQMFVESVSKIWVYRKDGRNYLIRNLDRTIKSEMNALGFAFSERLRMPWKNLEGEADRLSGYQGCGVDTTALLDELEMTPDELLSALWEMSRGKKKLWECAKAVLDLPVSEFEKIEGGGGSSQRSLFN